MDAIVVKRASLQDSDHVRDLYRQARHGRPEAANGRSGPDEPTEAIDGPHIVLVAVQCSRGVLQYLGYAQLTPHLEEGNKGWVLGELFVMPEAERGRVEQALLAGVSNYMDRLGRKERATEARASTALSYPCAEHA